MVRAHRTAPVLAWRPLRSKPHPPPPPVAENRPPAGGPGSGLPPEARLGRPVPGGGPEDAPGIDDELRPSPAGPLRLPLRHLRQQVAVEDVPSRGRPCIELGEQLGTDLGPGPPDLTLEPAPCGPELVAERLAHPGTWAWSAGLRFVLIEARPAEPGADPGPIGPVRLTPVGDVRVRATALDDGAGQILLAHSSTVTSGASAATRYAMSASSRAPTTRSTGL